MAAALSRVAAADFMGAKSIRRIAIIDTAFLCQRYGVSSLMIRRIENLNFFRHFVNPAARLAI